MASKRGVWVRLAWAGLGGSVAIAGCSGADGGDGGALDAFVVVERDASGESDAATIDGATAPDAALVDAAAGGRCVRDADCSDGLFCNGVEECRPSDPAADGLGCVGAAMPCLATQSCDEEADRCVTDCVRNADADDDGVVAVGCGTGTDCDDSNPRIYPGAPELCDDVDQDCDPSTFGTRDVDGDGATSSACCNPQAGGAVRCGPDCADTNRLVGPSATEVCDLYDNDCDGMSDEGVAVAGYLDADGDLHGDPGRPAEGCPGHARFSLIPDDCDDANPARHGAQPEYCNMADDDCDGALDEGAAAVAWYVDLDGDGFGAAGDMLMSCQPVAGRSLLRSDCDDTDVSVRPGQLEQCNAQDDNCDGLLTYRLARNDFEDDDADRSADAHCPVSAGGGADCDDGDPAIYPDALELDADGDNDCDGAVDEGCSGAPFYVDADGDGYGVEAGVMMSCTPIADRVTRAGDCNDADAAVHPRAAETCDGVDEDCDGAVDDFASLSCGDGRTVGVCDAGACEVETCARGRGDCDGSSANGCETDVASSITHCGACGTVCAATGAHRVASCAAGRCASACEPGWGDCNGLADDGCEVELANDAANCGACARSCVSRAGTIGRCESGACAFDCIVGRADCDGTIANGCETQTDRDPRHCGMCGNDCGSASCVGSACLTTLPSDVDVAENPTTMLSSFSYPGGYYRIPPGRYDFETLVVPEGQTLVVTGGTAVLDIRVRGAIEIRGTIDLSGGPGAPSAPAESPTRWALGGITGLPHQPIWSGVCGAGADGGGGGGVEGRGGDSGETNCFNGGAFGGGSVGSTGGGGGGGCAGGGGGRLGSWVGGAGGVCPGETAAAGATVSTACVGGGAAIDDVGAMYRGRGTSDLQSGCGGSIGAVAASDLAVASTFRPGSGGGASGGASSGSGAGGGAGGGGGGALRLVSLTSITVGANGVIRVNGGRGGSAAGVGADGGGGGGSGGVIVLAAPSVTNYGTISAVGGLGGTGAFGGGGAGGTGRVRVSTYIDRCLLGSIDPPARGACAASVQGGVPGYTYVARYPN